MNKYEQLKSERNVAHDATKTALNEFGNIATVAKRKADIAKNASIILADIDAQFDKATQLTGVDKNFLFTAVALQCIRQYVIGTLTQRTNHDVADESAHRIQDKLFGNDKKRIAENLSQEEWKKKISEAKENGTRYKATREEIFMSHSVPYDATNGTKSPGVGGFDEKGRGIGLSGKNHRYKTLGHDPLAGWIFGTANIMTNTLTNDRVQTFHVKNGSVVGVHGGFDKTVKMFEHFEIRSKEEKDLLAACVIKQGLHIMSDTYSKEGIMLPGTVILNSEYAGKLADYGLDFGNVIKIGAGAGVAVLINQIIAMIHGLLYDESRDMSWNLYSVRTRKILMYSNVIASSSNVIAVACGTVIGGLTGNEMMIKKSLNYLDIGGMMVTIHRLVNDKKFIYEVKKEFLEKQWYDLVMDEEF